MYQGSGNKENARSDFSKKCLIVKKKSINPYFGNAMEEFYSKIQVGTKEKKVRMNSHRRPASNNLLK